MSVLEFCLLGQSGIGLGLFQLLLLIGSVFLILLILVQRGKGGGLTGALGGMGGQSAFGAKAGDAFTKVTVITSLIWITLCMVTIALFNQPPPKTVKTSKSLIDIARERENGIVTDGEDLEIEGAGASSIGAPVDTPQAIEDQDAADQEKSDADTVSDDAKADDQSQPADDGDAAGDQASTTKQDDMDQSDPSDSAEETAAGQTKPADLGSGE